MTDCRDFGLLLASDEPEERARAARHALACAGCRAVFDAEKRLRARVDAWDTAVEPPPALEKRVRAAVSRRLTAIDAPGVTRRTGGRRFIALAAALLMAVGVGMWIGLRPSAGPSQARDLLVADALRDARRAEREHARAIASLERAAESRLSLADDPALPAAEAAMLLAYRDRIASLESTIEEVRDYLHENPGHSGARTVLLAAYRDKTEVLREVLALGEAT